MHMQRFRNLIIFIGALLLIVGVPYIGQAAPPAQGPITFDATLIDRLRNDTGGKVRISYHDETGKVRFIGATPSDSIAQPAVLGLAASSQDAARGFLATYGRLFGLRDPNIELRAMREAILADGRAFVRFRQIYQGVPILGGEIIVQMDQGRDIISANGELLPDLDLNITPKVDASAARQTALARVAKSHDLSVDALTAAEPELWVHNPALMGGPGRRISRLVWRIEVTPLELLPIRELVLVDAQLGIVILNFNQIHTALNRNVYDNNNNPAFGLPGNGPVRTEGGPASGIADVELAYEYAGDTYNFLLSEHSRDSLDDAGMTLISTTRYCPNSASCPYANAFWNGSQMAYGAGFSAADDVVGHELTHGVTEFSSDLFYYYQSGAINESFSDVWGEFIDQTNGSGTDTAAVKWKMGEDIPSIGAIRDMKDPTVFGDPDRIGSPNYWCGESDAGGVHINSGVNNKAVYLMTDGGTFNGRTVTGLGISKVADLYYEVQTNMLTSGANYHDLYDLLIQASINLGFSTAHQKAVKDAVEAVEMNQPPCGNALEAPICPVGQSPSHLFFDDLENPASGNWTIGGLAGSDWYYPPTSNPYAFPATYATSGINNFWGYNSGSTSDHFIAMTKDVSLPANAYLHFRHDWNFEDDTSNTYDGGVLEYSISAGSSWNDVGGLFSDNGYNGAIAASFGNPLGGRAAFVAESYGYTASRLNLSSLKGQDVRFRFRIGTDEIFDDFGWFVDDVRIYVCSNSITPTNFIYFPTIKN